MAFSKSIVALFLVLALVANTVQPSEAIRVTSKQSSAATEAPEKADASVEKPSAPSSGGQVPSFPFPLLPFPFFPLPGAGGAPTAAGQLPTFPFRCSHSSRRLLGRVVSCSRHFFHGLVILRRLVARLRCSPSHCFHSSRCPVAVVHRRLGRASCSLAYPCRSFRCSLDSHVLDHQAHQRLLVPQLRQSYQRTRRHHRSKK
jgi:hypothetical protein